MRMIQKLRLEEKTGVDFYEGILFIDRRQIEHRAKLNEIIGRINQLIASGMPVTNLDDPRLNCIHCGHEHELHKACLGFVCLVFPMAESAR